MFKIKIKYSKVKSYSKIEKFKIEKIFKVELNIQQYNKILKKIE